MWGGMCGHVWAPLATLGVQAGLFLWHTPGAVGPSGAEAEATGHLNWVLALLGLELPDTC